MPWRPWARLADTCAHLVKLHLRAAREELAGGIKGHFAGVTPFRPAVFAALGLKALANCCQSRKEQLTTWPPLPRGLHPCRDLTGSVTVLRTFASLTGTHSTAFLEAVDAFRGSSCG